MVGQLAPFHQRFRYAELRCANEKFSYSFGMMIFLMTHFIELIWMSLLTAFSGYSESRQYLISL